MTVIKTLSPEPAYRLFVTRRNTAQKDFASNRQSLASHLNQHLAAGCDGIYVMEVASGKIKYVTLVDGQACWTDVPERMARTVRTYF